MACIHISSAIAGKLGCCIWGKQVSRRGNDHFKTPCQQCHSKAVKVDLHKVKDARCNKGLSFTHEERQRLSILGLIPPAYQDVQLQLLNVCSQFFAREKKIDQYEYLTQLRWHNEQLFYRFVSEKLWDVMPVIYTPTVGEACVNFSRFHDSVNGLYVSRYDKCHMVEVFRNWPNQDIRAVCVTDGERILGLGDQGANGMGIPVGKLDLYAVLAKISPEYLIPMVLDVGTNNKVLLEDPLYVGVRQKRLRDAEYEELVQEFVDAVVTCWGTQCIIHFEDFGTPNAFKFVNKYQDKYCAFNDDIQGTSATGLAGFLGVERITKMPLQEHVIMFAGAGSACIGMAKLLVLELLKRKVSEDKATSNIYVVDADGVLSKNSKNLLPDMKPFIRDVPPTSLEELIEKFKPSILVGATGQPGIFTEKIIRSMAKNHKRPAIFACSNPTSKSECTAEQAITFSEGRALFCSGSPFPPVVLDGKRITPGQINNAFAFPGIVLAVFCCRPYRIPDEFFLITARAISDYAAADKPNSDVLYPSAKKAAEVAFSIAVRLSKYIFKNKLANVFPEPDNICEFLRKQQYHPTYTNALPGTWCYPKPKCSK